MTERSRAGPIRWLYTPRCPRALPKYLNSMACDSIRRAMVTRVGEPYAEHSRVDAL